MKAALSNPRSLASRLATLYTVLLGITILLVIVASSVALVYELASFGNDVLIAKHEEARFLAARYQHEGLSLAQAAPRIASAVSGIGFHVAIYDTKGKFLGGDPSVRPELLARVLEGSVRLPGAGRPGAVLETRGSAGPPPPQHDWWRLTAIEGGYAAFSASDWIIFMNLFPYWWIVVGIGIVAIVASWFIGRIFARQALTPLSEVTNSLQALAAGDYTQRRFIMSGGDEIATLTSAYNDAAASVAAAMEERRKTEDRMRQFVADAGHELRTPLTVISGYIDVLRRGALEEPKVAKQILGTIALEKEHMRTLIDRLMRLARMDSETEPMREAIDVGEFLRQQCEAARRYDEQREIDYHSDGVTQVEGDKIELGEAVWNAIENALKYAPGAPVHLRAYRDNGQTVISVKDEGPGMTEAERLHAFERFFRGDARGEIPGAGLGLAIAKRAVERSGGTIELESAPGHGTNVLIKL